MKIYRKHLAIAEYGNNPMFTEVDLKTLDNASYPEMVKLIKEATANAAEYTFVFVGNVDVEKLKGLLETYIASLPAAKVKEIKDPKYPTSITLASGQVKDEFTQKMSSPVTMATDIYSGDNLDYTPANAIMTSMTGRILSRVYLETLREEMGGTYSPSAAAYIDPTTKQWIIFYSFETNADILSKMNERAEKELKDLLKNGAKEADFNMIKEANIKQYEIMVRTNSYWSSALRNMVLGIDTVTGFEEFYKNVTLDQLNSFMKTLNIDKNRIQVIMIGEKAE